MTLEIQSRWRLPGLALFLCVCAGALITLRNTIAQLKEKQIAERDTTITQLRTDKTTLEEQIAEKDNTITALGRTITQLRGQAADTTITQLRDQAAEKDTTITQLQARIQEQEAETARLQEQIERLQGKPKSQPKDGTETPYDVVIKANSVLDITEGWQVEYKKRPASSDTDLAEGNKFFKVDMEGNFVDATTTEVTVSALGLFGTGKTWFLNKLFKAKFPSGYLVRTEGLSVVFPEGHEGTNTLLLDMAGSDEAVGQGDYLNKRVTEAFLRELGIYLSDVVCIVVNRLHATDQAYIRAVVDLVKKKNTTTRVLVIHNLFNITSNQGVDQVVQEDLLNSCGATAKEMAVGEVLCPFYISSWSGVELEHFIFARDETEAGDKHNEATRKALVSIFQATKTNGKRQSLIKEVCEFSSSRIPQLVMGSPSLQIKPHIQRGQVSLKAVGDTTQGLVTLTLSDNLIVVDGGSIYGGNFQTSKDKWTPRTATFEFPDRFVLVLELAGFADGDIQFTPKVQKLQGGGEIQKLAIKSNKERKILPTEETPQNTWENTIPSGRCEVEVVIPSRVRMSKRSEITWTQNTGLWFGTMMKDIIEDYGEGSS